MGVTYDRTYTLRTYDDTFEKARSVFKKNDLNVAQAFNRFLKQVALTGELDLLSEDELLFRQLQSEIKQSMDDVEAGAKTYTIEEVRAELGL